MYSTYGQFVIFFVLHSFLMILSIFSVSIRFILISSAQYFHCASIAFLIYLYLELLMSLHAEILITKGSACAVSCLVTYMVYLSGHLGQNAGDSRNLSHCLTTVVMAFFK